MNLSRHFTKKEFEKSDTADKYGLDNSIPNNLLGRATSVAEQMETVRALLDNKPIIVTSGYRSPAVNARVGGVSTSAHALMYAIDFRCPQFGTPMEICQAIAGSRIKFDQLIHELQSWVHISFDPRMRMDILTYKNVNGKNTYVKGIV